MASLLAEAGPAAALCHQLKEVLAPGFVERSGCVILETAALSATSENRAASHDEMGFEGFLNHVHISDFVEDEHRTVVGQGLAFVSELEAMLEAQYPDREFEVILTVGDDTAVRFHQRRPDQMWLLPDLESYAEEAVLVSHVDAPRSTRR